MRLRIHPPYIPVVASAALALTAILVVPQAATASTPSCRTVLVEENSGAGPNYPLKVCNSGPFVITNPGTGKEWVFIVDGGPLPEHSTRIPTIVITEVKNIG